MLVVLCTILAVFGKAFETEIRTGVKIFPHWLRYKRSEFRNRRNCRRIIRNFRRGEPSRPLGLIQSNVGAAWAASEVGAKIRNLASDRNFLIQLENRLVVLELYRKLGLKGRPLFMVLDRLGDQP